MEDYTDPRYDVYRNWILDARRDNMSWDEILNGPDGDLSTFLRYTFRNRINEVDWREIVAIARADEENRVEIARTLTTLENPTQRNDINVPEAEGSAWQCYKRRLRRRGFGANTIQVMEDKTLEILQKLSRDTVAAEQPVKGMVIGNVQSGKTANMAGLMAMAADWGWNFFIVLSGTIENLRRQTQGRLLNDLVNDECTSVEWVGLEHLSGTIEAPHRLQDINLGEGSHSRYFTVNLKNAGRLESLIEWLKKDLRKRQQLKILIIDDEADQAGINTARIDLGRITTISNLIRNLVNGMDGDGHPVAACYRAMNYIGYTATPYANILNEAPAPTNLYPSSFITTLDPVLKASKEYFGPQQIFGLEGDDYSEEDQCNPLGIVRVIPDDDEQQIRNLQEHENCGLPSSFLDAFCWFICGAACMRFWGLRKPVSMLIHTSQGTDDHDLIAQEIRAWFVDNTIDQIVERCREVWSTETAEFSLESLRQNYPDYARLNLVQDYPTFDEIEDYIRTLLSHEISHIPLDTEGAVNYHCGIHLCVDNCQNNGVLVGNGGNEYRVRLVYPSNEVMDRLDVAPAFIVVGGATLSRGLTIEGLISTFFMRDSRQEDTLMQMGRWFGYRKGYELLPRVWMPSQVKKRFEIMSKVDFSLRQEIHEMASLGRLPSQYAPKVIQSPKLTFLRITAPSRMQGAKVDLDYGGTYNQTYLFDNDAQILQSNIEVTNNLLNAIGAPEGLKEINRAHVGNAKVWRNVDFSHITAFLRAFQFQRNQVVFANIDKAIQWIEENSRPQTGRDTLPAWNVVLSSNSGDDESRAFDIAGQHVYMVNRSRKVSTNGDNRILNIGALRNPSDIMADIDLEGHEDLVGTLTGLGSNDAKIKRREAGLGSIPQMLIYVIDRNSVPRNANAGTREPLNAPENIIGICLNIPELMGTHTTVSVNIQNNADEEPVEQ